MLLIVTDGEIAYVSFDKLFLSSLRTATDRERVIRDFDATVAALVAASRCALSIVIVGVGEADFSNMKALDSVRFFYCCLHGVIMLVADAAVGRCFIVLSGSSC